jgi:hypothetical protein
MAIAAVRVTHADFQRFTTLQNFAGFHQEYPLWLPINVKKKSKFTSMDSQRQMGSGIH